MALTVSARARLSGPSTGVLIKVAALCAAIGIGSSITEYADFGKWLAQGRSTMDRAARQDAYNKATAVMCEEAPVLFLYTQPTTYGVSKRVVWQARGDDWVRAFDMKPVQ